MASASSQATRNGPWLHHFLVYVFTGVFTLLAYWLLGFIIDDIGNWPGPQYNEVEERLLDRSLVEQSQLLKRKSADIERQMREQKGRQEILRDSTTNSQNTMNQLLELQKLALQKNVTTTAEELKALAESEELFLSNQRQYQRLNEEIATLNGQLRSVHELTRELEESLGSKRGPIQQEYDALVQKHNLKIAVAKLAAIAPFLLLAFLLFLIVYAQ